MIFKTIPEIEYLLQEIDNVILNNGSNIEFEKIYKDYLIKYPSNKKTSSLKNNTPKENGTIRYKRIL